MRFARRLSTSTRHAAIGWVVGCMLGLTPLPALVPSAAAAEPLALRTASQVGVPFKFAPNNPDRPGICIEIMQALARIDPRLSFKGIERELPLKRIEADLADGELDVFFALIKTPERSALHFIDRPALYPVRHVVAVRANDSVHIESLADIRALGKDGLILTTQGTAYPQYLNDFKGLLIDTSTSNNAQLLKMLLAGRGRFFYQGDSTLRDAIAAAKVQDEVRLLPTVFKVDDQLVAVAPKLSASQRQRLQNALLQLDQRGELQRLRAKYGVG